MADAEYDVGSRITLDTKQAETNARKLSSEMRSLGESIRGTNSLVSSMGTRLFALGSAYLGFHAIKNAVSSVTRSMFEFEKETSRTQIGLASVFSAVENVSFSKAQAMAENVYGKLVDDAIESVATTKELFDIYAGIVGPIRAAGFELDKVRDITKDVVNASSALGVDFPQAKRDVAAMSRGAAGMDVKLFQMLRSMNLIKEDAKEFNALTQKSRIEKMAEALKKAGVGGAAFGRSLPGRISTFVDVIEQFRRSLARPVFDAFADRLGEVNDYLIKNRNSITSYLVRVGTQMVISFDTAFDRAITGAKWVSEHWDSIIEKTREVVARMEVVAPQLAKAYLGLSIGRQLVGGGMQALGTAGQMGMRFGGGAASAAAGTAAGATLAKAVEEGMGNALLAPHMLGSSSYATNMAKMPEYVPQVIGFGAASAAEGTAAGAAAAGGGGMSAAAVGMAAFGVAIAAVGSIVYAVTDQWQVFKPALEETMKPLHKLWETTKTLGEHLWQVARPLVRIVGGALFMGLTQGIEYTVTGLERFLSFVDIFVSKIAEYANGLDEVVKFVMEKSIGALEKHFRGIRDFVYGTRPDKPLDYTGKDRERNRRTGPQISTMPFAKPASDKRPMFVNDFRNSRFTIKQEFKNSDPDRIMRIFTNGLAKQAERRLQSPYAPAFSR